MHTAQAAQARTSRASNISQPFTQRALCLSYYRVPMIGFGRFVTIAHVELSLQPRGDHRLHKFVPFYGQKFCALEKGFPTSPWYLEGVWSKHRCGEQDIFFEVSIFLPISEWWRILCEHWKAGIFFGSNKCRKCDVFPSCLLGGTSSKRQSRFPIGNMLGVNEK